MRASDATRPGIAMLVEAFLELGRKAPDEACRVVELHVEAFLEHWPDVVANAVAKRERTP